MEERRGTVEGVTHALPAPFMVFATQNPSDQSGTFPLPESQLDRFLIALDVPASVTALRARTNPDATLELRSSDNKRLSYRADSSAGGLLPVAGSINRAFYLQLPPEVPQSIARLAHRIRTEGSGDERRLKLLAQYSVFHPGRTVAAEFFPPSETEVRSSRAAGAAGVVQACRSGG